MRASATLLLLAAASASASVVIDQTLTSTSGNTLSNTVQVIQAPANDVGWILTSLDFAGLGNFSSTQADPSLYAVTFWTSAAATVLVGDVVVASASTAPVALNYGWKSFGLSFDLSGADIVYDSGETIYFSIQTVQTAWLLLGTITQDNQAGWSHLNGGKTGIVLEATPVPEPSTYGLILGGLALAGAAVRRRRAKRG